MVKGKHIRTGPGGELQELFCKMCGAAIGGYVAVSKGFHSVGNRQVERMVERFQRFENYRELTIKLVNPDNGMASLHVTNGCKKCMRLNLTVEELQALYDKDVESMPGAFSERDKARVPEGVLGVS